jgi:nucleotide-binding universal stress UspA family protein
MYNRILVPTDGSDPATDAAVHGFEHAERDGAAVHILCVVETDSRVPVDTAVGIGDLATFDRAVRSALEAEGATITEALADRAAAMGLETVTAVRSGHARDTIVDYATECDIDLIVMGTHGRSGIERLLLGSVTEQVLRASPVPVLVVRALTTDSQPRGERDGIE